MPIPTLPPYSTPPSSSDPANFAARADVKVAQDVTFVETMNDGVIPGINDAVDDVNAAYAAGLADAADNAADAQAARVAAEAQVPLAAAQVTLATTQADRAEDEADRAAQAAADAEAAAGVIPPTSGNAGKFLRVNSGATGTEWWPSGELVRQARTANIAIDDGNLGNWIDITSGSFTQTFDAAGTLGSGWWCYLSNSGTGVITLDPNGADTIDGAATLVLRPGERVLVQCDGAALRTILRGSNIARKPLFAAEVADMRGGSTMEIIENLLVTPNAGASGPPRVAANGSLFVAFSNNAGNPAATSPDGRVWTNRTMPASGAWFPASDGASFLAVQNTATNTAFSAAGTTWAAATALPGNITSGAQLCAIPGRYAVRGAASGTTIYLTVNDGTSWTTETAPASNFDMFTVGGLFVLRGASGTTYYTSATGATGSWTARTIPGGVTSTVVYQAPDGSLLAAPPTLGASCFRTLDGLTWSAALGAIPVAAGLSAINGVVMSGSTGNFATLNGGKWQPRNYSGTALGTGTRMARLGSIYLIPSNTGATALLIDADAADSATGLFS